MSDILATKSISKRFGALVALRDITLRVAPGETVGLIGPNGAGKTTLFNVVLGALDPDRGHVSFRDRDISRLAAHDRARLGIGRTFQRLELFGSMTPRGHLLVAAQARRRPGLLADLVGRGVPTDAERARATELLELVGLTAQADDPVESLSLGMRRMVELGRALMNGPDLLLLDEPSSGLDRREAESFADVLDAVRATRETAVLFVEHNVDLVLRVVSRLYVMDAGSVVAEGDPAEVVGSEVVRRAYLGDLEGQVPAGSSRSPAPDASRPPASPPPEPLLELRDIDASYGEFRALFGVNMEIRPGTVTALLGSNGSGKTTVARVCSGLVRPTRGEVHFDGTNVTGMRAHELSRLGILHVPEGRSVFATLTVEENLVLSFRQLVGRRAVRASLDQAYQMFPRLGERRGQTAATLSGGEQRMLALARAMPHPPRLLIADELSLGLAPIVVEEVFNTVRTLRAAGTALLIVEQHIGKALEFADDAVVLRSGEVVHAGPVADLGVVLDSLLPNRGNR